MKAKKILSLILAVAMIFGTMSFNAFAEVTEELGGADFAANDGMTVFDGTTYYDTLAAAVNGVHGTKGATLYCKPGADVGTLNHAHVCKDLTVYGNGAYISGGEQDFELDMPSATGNSCVGLTEDVTLTVDNLTGASAWGTKNTEHDINLVFTNCQNMDKVSFYNFSAVSDTLGDINISLTDCTFTDNEPSAKVFSHMPGTVELNNVDFSGISQPVSFGNKLNRELSVTLTECDFENCGSSDADYNVPVSVKATAANGTAALVVDSCTFSGTTTSTANNGADVLLDGGNGKTTATVLNTASNVGVEDSNGVVANCYTTEEDKIAIDNKTATASKVVAKVDDAYYSDIVTAFKAVKENSVVDFLADVIYEGRWDCRNYGSTGCYGRMDVPVTINGNGHTFKVIGKVDDSNNYAIFRFTSDAVVDDLTFDLTEAVSGFQQRISAISSEGGNLTVTDCEFIGSNTDYARTKAIIAGETNQAASAVANAEITIDGCTFTNWKYGVSDGQNQKDTASIVITDSDFIDSNVNVSSSEEVTITGNEFNGGYVKVTSYSYPNNLVVTVLDNVIDETMGSENAIKCGAVINVQEGFVMPEAEVGGYHYSTINAAIAAAADGDTITILPGTYDAFTVPETKNDLTFVGTTDAEGNNLVTIRTLEDDIDTPTKGIYVQAEKATFRNLDIVSGSTLVKWLCSALGATNNSVGLGHSYLNDLTVENCNFKGNGSKYAIWTRACDVDIIDSTFDGYLIPVENYNLGETKPQEINIINVEINNASNAIHTVNTKPGSIINVEDSVISADMIHVSGDGGDFIIDGSVLDDVDVEIMKGINLEVTDSAVYSSTFNKNANSTGTMTLSELYVENINEVAYNSKKQGIVFDSYYATLEDYEAKTNLRDVPNVADALYVEFEDVTATDAEGEKVYNINLVAPTSQTINRLNSVDLEFILNNDNGSNEYEIIASNDEVTINNVEGNRYEFHYADKDSDVDTDTAATITIGQVKFTGYGQFDFAVKSNDTNVAHATTIGDNMVDTYLPNGDETTVAEGELVISDDTVTDVVIEVPTRALEVEIDFNNAVNKQVADYQDMTVIVSGGDLPANIEIELGNVNYTEDVEIFGKSDAEYSVVADADNKYTVNVTGALSVNRTYTVTVKGAGYRTVRKNITMAEDKTVANKLNFWNNVKDVEGADYLAGDIVKDNVINVYDLSAVVSYFGTINNVSIESTYAKYDLNRDGKVDSKDVAYVLVSWGK